MTPAGEQPSAVLVVRSFDAFYRAEYRSVVALAAVLSGSRLGAEDLAQEAFAAAYRKWDHVGTYEYPNLWVRRVVANKSVSLIRRSVAEAKARTRYGERPPLSAMPDESEDVWDAVRRLPRRQTQAIALVYLDGLSAEEAGAVLGCSGGTVKTHLKRGRATLAKKLGDIYGVPA
ncbi:MAG: sigma-70 family RNA polymerase sigma factor [Acidimicrobiia bacterium]